MRMRIMIAAAVVAVGSLVVGLLGVNAGAAPERGATSSVAHSIAVDGVARTYHVYRPSSAAGPVPLVVMIHGGFGSAAQAEQSYGWDRMAERGRFAVAYPDGIGRSWNAGTCCGTASNRKVDDVAFITAMVAQISHRMPIDRSRVFATGMSNGAMMALRLACETTAFTAVAPVAGTQLVGCGGARPTSVLQIHGTADARVPYRGGPGEAFSFRGARVDGPSIPSVNERWRATDSCAAPTVTTRGSVTTSTARCANHRTVQLISVSGAGHQWPGSAPHPGLQRTLGTDPPSTAFSATQVIWRFFAAV